MTGAPRPGLLLPRRRAAALAGWLALPAAAVLIASCGGEERADAPLPAPPRVVDVTMREFSFEHTRRIGPGRVVFRAHNRGRAPHEIVLVPLPKDLPPLDKQLRSKRRRPVVPLARLQPLDPGTSGAFAVDLEPGRYGMVDFLSARDGKINGVKGMNSEFRVR